MLNLKDNSAPINFDWTFFSFLSVKITLFSKVITEIWEHSKINMSGSIVRVR